MLLFVLDHGCRTKSKDSVFEIKRQIDEGVGGLARAMN